MEGEALVEGAGAVKRDPSKLWAWRRRSKPLKSTPFERRSKGLSKCSQLSRSPLARVGRRKKREKRQKLVEGPLCERVRRMPCCVCGKPGPSHAHHVTGGTLRRDYLPDGTPNVVPLCAGPDGHHTGNQGVHTLGPETFRARFGVDLSAIAAEIGR